MNPSDDRGTITLIADLEALLEQLGDEEDRVARTLHWAGIEGRRRSTLHCPVSNYVRLY